MNAVLRVPVIGSATSVPVLAGPPSRRRIPALLCPLAAILLVLTASPSAVAGTSGAASSTVVLDWERTSIRTVYTENLTPIPVGALYLGFTSLAMYRAVRLAGPWHGSAQAAVATAAHDRGSASSGR